MIAKSFVSISPSPSPLIHAYQRKLVTTRQNESLNKGEGEGKQAISFDTISRIHRVRVPFSLSGIVKNSTANFSCSGILFYNFLFLVHLRILNY